MAAVDVGPMALWREFRAVSEAMKLPSNGPALDDLDSSLAELERVLQTLVVADLESALVVALYLHDQAAIGADVPAETAGRLVEGLRLLQERVSLCVSPGAAAAVRQDGACLKAA